MSSLCPRCGATLERVRRSTIQKVLFRKMLRCSSCAYEAREWRAPFETETTFVFSRHTRCIHCGTYRVRRLRGRDRIDSMSAHPLSLLFALAWAPIYHCNACRLQYRDWRPTAPFIEAKNSSAAVSAGAE